MVNAILKKEERNTLYVQEGYLASQEEVEDEDPLSLFESLKVEEANLTEQKEKFLPEADKKVAFFCTMGGSGDKNAFSEMEKILATRKSSASLCFSAGTGLSGVPFPVPICSREW